MRGFRPAEQADRLGCATYTRISTDEERQPNDETPVGVGSVPGSVRVRGDSLGSCCGFRLGDRWGVGAFRASRPLLGALAVLCSRHDERRSGWVPDRRSHGGRRLGAVVFCDGHRDSVDDCGV